MLSPRKHPFNKTGTYAVKPEEENPDTVQGGEATPKNFNKSEKSGKQRTDSITAQAKTSNGNFTKILVDTQIELDVYPRLIYF